MFAATNECLRRATGMEYYDVQLQAGYSLVTGSIAEMQTGEGKTMVAALPAAFHALSNKGVHVVTRNEFLAQRDCAFVEPILCQLGLTIRPLPSTFDLDKVQNAYQADVTYGASCQFALDYLRDQHARTEPIARSAGSWGNRHTLRVDSTEVRLQRPLSFAIIDDVDSVILDESHTPFVLNTPCSLEEDADAYQRASEVTANFVEGEHYRHLRNNAHAIVTPAGAALAVETLQSADTCVLSRPWLKYVQNALQAAVSLRRDVDYIVHNDAVLMIDPETGRVAPDRKLTDGLHQAIELKEGVSATSCCMATASIARQSYFRNYPNLCGMTAAADYTEAEFRSVLGMSVETYPLHRQCRRHGHPTRYFASREDKLLAVVEDVSQRNRLGQPVLVETRSVASSKLFSERLARESIPHAVLIGAQDEAESMLVSRAGRRSAVTIATNFAGQGTDITACREAAELGGLHILATEHHESARLDRHLVGRCARQGQLGSFQFMVSADDQLIAVHAPELASEMKRTLSGQGVQSEEYDRAVRRIQMKLDRKQAERRAQMMTEESSAGQLLD